MSKDWYTDIQEFHKVVMQDKFPTKPYVPSRSLVELRMKLIEEETLETLDSLYLFDPPRTAEDCVVRGLAELADGIVDSIVVLLGTAVTFGIDIRPIWNIIHATNMAKEDGPVRPDGKKLKPEGWKPPDVVSEIRRQRNGSSPNSSN